MKHKQRIENIIKNGYQLDLGEVLTKSFEVYKKTALITALALFVIGIIIIIAFVILLAFIGINIAAFENLDPSSSYPEVLETFGFGLPYFLVTLIFIAITSLLFAPIGAGFIGLCKDARNGKEVEFSSIFKYYKSTYFGNIVLLQIIVSVITTIATYGIETLIPFQIIGFTISVIISSITALALPLIIFRDFNVPEALEASAKLVTKNFLIIFVIFLIGTIIAFLGIFLCFIGILATLPITYAIQYCVYDEIVGDDETSEIEMIGNTED